MGTRKTNSMSAICVIPARYGSTRLPGKPLALIGGKPMIEWVYSRTSQARFIDDVIVATDDQRILDSVTAFGGKCVLTDPAHPSGTDRVAEAVGPVDCAVIINVQGDEPFIESDEIDMLARMMLDNPEVGMGTLVRTAEISDGFDDPKTAKVVVDSENNALYFSRSPIPYWREEKNGKPPDTYIQQVGVYAFRRETLLRFVSWPPSPLEKCEKLEQLRALENGVRIRVVETPYSHFSVDRPEDLKRAREWAAGLRD
jgi:3-deoxy-manno-octulosonate cytidylyltransferase (CMP-KDO synthetase)